MQYSLIVCVVATTALAAGGGEGDGGQIHQHVL